MASRFEALRSDDLLLLICDPQLRPVAELIETSAWEASLCPVQRTDVRNFAHGRHSWLHHHPDRSMVLGLVGKDGLPLWHAVAARLPDIRRSEEQTSELQSLMRISYDVICLKKNTQ